MASAVAHLMADIVHPSLLSPGWPPFLACFTFNVAFCAFLFFVAARGVIDPLLAAIHSPEQRREKKETGKVLALYLNFPEMWAATGGPSLLG